MTTKFVTDPPERQQGRTPGEFAAFLDDVQAHPGKWGMRQYGSLNSASGLTAPLKRQGFQATARTNDDGTATLYVMWPK